MKRKYTPIFDSISFFTIYFLSLYLGFFSINIYLIGILALIFFLGIMLSYINGNEKEESLMDVMNRMFLAIYVILITVLIMFTFSLLSLSTFTDIVLGAVYAVFLIIIFILSLKDFFKIISGN